MYAIRISSVASNASSEPVSVDEIKSHLKITTTAEDALIATYRTAARQVAENLTKRSLIDTQRILVLDSFYSSHIELPYGSPLATSTGEVSITYRKTTGDSTTVPSTSYWVDVKAEPGFVRLNYDSDWPTDVQDSEGCIEVTYRSGYINDTCPVAIKHWIKMRVGQMFEYREPLYSGPGLQNLNYEFIDGLLDEYRLPSL